MVSAAEMTDRAFPAETALAARALSLWPLPEDVRPRLINIAENLTFLVEEPGGFRAVLRLHREGYHSAAAIRSELAWSAALTAEGGVTAPAALPGRDGRRVQAAEGRLLTLFEFIDGEQPREDQDLSAPFRALGGIAARAHLHALRWTRPASFVRQEWNLVSVFGADPIWGHWRAGPNVGAAERRVLERAEAEIVRALTRYGVGPGRYGLIHADMRLANLLIRDGAPRLIDFDDCGFGWFMYDFAAAISFMEDSPQVPALTAAWLEGYRSVRALPREDEAMIGALVMFRRLALLGWIGSRIEAPEPQALAPQFAPVSATLAEAWLAGSV